MSVRLISGVAALAMVLPILYGDQDDGRGKPGEERVTLTGQVRPLNTALREFGLKFDDDAPGGMAMVTDAGEVHLILKDERGRAFYQDERLRERPLQLFLRRWKGIPAVQVLNVYSIKEDKLYEVDYWCDVCSIVTYDVRLCPCCQDVFGPMRLRERLMPERPKNTGS